MYFRFSTLLSVAALAGVATAWDCSTGSTYCCDSTASVGSEAVSLLAGLLGIDLSGLTGLVGLTCVLGLDSCSQQPVCCTGNDYSGLLVVGCSPITA